MAVRDAAFMTIHSSGKPDVSQDPDSQQVLTFELGGEMYGVEILRVQEIRGWSSVTRIPYAPRHVLGILNLRGSIVPIVDLRIRFELESLEYNKVTVIIVLSVNTPGGRRDVGVVVDAVSDVVTINSADIKQAPDLGSNLSTDYLRGLVLVGERMVILLDTDAVVGTQLTPIQPETLEIETAEAA
jgi:purine-binding chemotaxis protein CheW